MKTIKYPIGIFELVFSLPNHKADKLKIYLDSESIPYSNMHYANEQHFAIRCDDFTDAAKIETYLQTN